jgi:putative ABC transport system substrate-binding protein
MAIDIGRRKLFAALGSAAVWPLASRAQQSMPVIGFLSSLSPNELADVMPAFQKGLAESSFVERRNITIEYRWAEGHYERLPALAADLVRRQVTVRRFSMGSQILQIWGEVSCRRANVR